MSDDSEADTDPFPATRPLEEVEDPPADHAREGDRAATGDAAEEAIEHVPEAVDEEPFGDLVERVRDRDRAGDPELGELFDEADVGEVDSDTLWEQVESEDPVAATPPEDEEWVIEKAKYCEKCEFFAGPPRMACTNEGTAILELVDLEHVRVRNCPIAREDEDLETID